MSEVKSGRPPRATCGARNRKLRFAMGVLMERKQIEDRDVETTARK